MIAPKVLKFAARFADKLEVDQWGDIDLELFREIAQDPEETWSDDAKSLAKCLSEALR